MANPEYKACADDIFNPEFEQKITEYILDEVKKQTKSDLNLDSNQELLVETKLYFPLYILAEANVGGCDLDEMPSQCFIDYSDLINSAIDKTFKEEEKIRGLAEWFFNETAVNKVFSAIPSVEVRDDDLVGVITLKTYGEINSSEMDVIKEDLLGALYDGWGESFEQRSLKAGEDEIYVSFRYYAEECSLELENQSQPQGFMPTM